MRRRSKAREVALQVLFMRDQHTQLGPEQIQPFLEERLDEPVARPFCYSLLEGVQQYHTTIDDAIQAAADNWKIQRMLPVDRNVLRLAVFELFFLDPPTPTPVGIDEAIELARRFGGKESPAFVNGILDRIVRQGVSTP